LNLKAGSFLNHKPSIVTIPSPTIAICLTGDMSIDYRVHKTAETLLGMGYAVTCVVRVRKDYGRVAKAPYRVVYLHTLFEKGPLFYLVFNVRLMGWLLWHRPDRILSIDLDTLPGCVSAGKLIRRKVVFDSHEYFPEVPELQNRPMVKRMWLRLERFFVPKIDKGYTVCRSIADIYQQKYGVPFDVVRNLPQRKKIDQGPVVVKPSVFTMVYQGAVNVGRGITETIDAMPLLEDVRLVVVGDGDSMPQVKERVRQLGLEDRVEFVGKVPFAQLSQYTTRAHVGLCLLENLGLNYYYSLPNRIFDFAQAGVPVLASNFPEIRAVVHTYNTGVLVDDLQPQTIANAIRQLITDKEAYDAMCRNALSVAETLVWENEAKVLKTLLGVDVVRSMFNVQF
jgi:glycosyltransferase involved in cell wall biosynthesis